jgi:hypothetical protein
MSDYERNANGVSIRRSRRLRGLQSPAIDRFVELMDADFFSEHIVPHLSQASMVDAMHAFPQLHVNPWDYRAIIGRIPAFLMRNPDE